MGDYNTLRSLACSVTNRTIEKNDNNPLSFMYVKWNASICTLIETWWLYNDVHCKHEYHDMATKVANNGRTWKIHYIHGTSQGMYRCVGLRNKAREIDYKLRHDRFITTSNANTSTIWPATQQQRSELSWRCARVQLMTQHTGRDTAYLHSNMF